MIIKEVTMFEASDGAKFPTREAAQRHQNWVDFREWYATERIAVDQDFDSAPVTVDAYAVYEWLEDNKEFLLQILGEMK